MKWLVVSALSVTNNLMTGKLSSHIWLLASYCRQVWKKACALESGRVVFIWFEDEEGEGSVKRSVSRLPTMQHSPRKHHEPISGRFVCVSPGWRYLRERMLSMCVLDRTIMWRLQWWYLKYNAVTWHFMRFWCVMQKGILGVCVCEVKQEPPKAFLSHSYTLFVPTNLCISNHISHLLHVLSSEVMQ